MGFEPEHPDSRNQRSIQEREVDFMFCSSQEVAFGQTTDAKKMSNLFDIQAISGHHMSLVIASVCFSEKLSLLCLRSVSSCRREIGQGVLQASEKVREPM
ncbi:hypothetical protein Tsubulata_041526 [Turnera subulata]|uniref:Uncharacterized protein n=1 Tax=Turnera subulata TaxID=218843 RepID=A0A9Q0FRK4_9ROSI|nr:hypothetical protein Tsubulata_041526 [Turnera subulata]